MHWYCDNFYDICSNSTQFGILDRNILNRLNCSLIFIEAQNLLKACLFLVWRVSTINLSETCYSLDSKTAVDKSMSTLFRNRLLGFLQQKTELVAK